MAVDDDNDNAANKKEKMDVAERDEVCSGPQSRQEPS